jgi:hypothetical protein
MQQYSSTNKDKNKELTMVIGNASRQCNFRKYQKKNASNTLYMTK